MRCYEHHGISFSALSHLESLGCIQFNSFVGFRRVGLPKKLTVAYYGTPVELTFSKDGDNDLDIGAVLLTRAGQELARVCSSRPVDGFFNFVYDRWAAESLVPKRETEQGASVVS